MHTMDPLKIFSEWFEEAKRHPEIADHTAMALATADSRGRPSVRVVLLKALDERGFVFYTNMESRKSNDLKENPYASLCFFWPPLGRQVRIEGKAEPVSSKEADAYFNTRPLESRIGAWASAQSRPLDSRAALMRKVEEVKAKYPEATSLPRPTYWSGWRVIPEAIEFWKLGEARLHDRDLYIREGKSWKVQKLYP